MDERERIEEDRLGQGERPQETEDVDTVDEPEMDEVSVIPGPPQI